MAQSIGKTWPRREGTPWMQTQEEYGGRTENRQPQICASTQGYPDRYQWRVMTAQVSKRRHPQSAHKRGCHYWMTYNYPFSSLNQHPSPGNNDDDYQYHYLHIRHHTRSTQVNWQLPPVDQRNKLCNDILWVDQIHAQDYQALDKISNIKHITKITTKETLKYCNQYHIKGK